MDKENLKAPPTKIVNVFKNSTIHATNLHTGSGRNIVSDVKQDLHVGDKRNWYLLQDCKELRQLLERILKENCSIDGVQCLEAFNQSVSFVPLQITRQSSDSQFKESGHYHNRKELLNLISNPPIGNISPEELFSAAKQNAKSCVGWKRALTEEAKVKYLNLHGNIVGVIGQAGIGKTTITKVLLKQTLSGDLYDFEYVFYIKFRDINYAKKTNLLNFLCKALSCDWIDDKQRYINVLRELSASEKVYIIMDGFDEANINLDLLPQSVAEIQVDSLPEDFIFGLLNGTIFPKAKKIITSRPQQLIDLPDSYRPDFIVKILGITKEAQKSICKDICADNHEKVFEHIYSHAQLSACCFVPINCILIMHVMKQMTVQQGNPTRLPASITQILSVVVLLFLQTQHLRPDFDLQKLTELAWNGIVNKKLYFNEQDLKSVGLSEIDKNTFTVTIKRKNENNKLALFTMSTTSYTYFSHLLFQEFFAALYLMFFIDAKAFQKIFLSDSDSNFHKLQFRLNRKIKKNEINLNESRYENIANFLFGFCSQSTIRIFQDNITNLKLEVSTNKIKILKTVIAKQLDSLRSKSLTTRDTFQRILQISAWIHEINEDNFTQKMAAKLPRLIFLSGDVLPFDVAPLHYVLRATSRVLTVEINRHANFVGDSLTRFLQELKTTIESQPQIMVKNLYLSNNEIGNSGALCLSSCMSYLEELYVESCNITAPGIKTISHSIKLRPKTRKMKKLDLSGNNIGDEGVEYLSLCLVSVEELYLEGCGITCQGASVLSEKISQLREPVLKGLNVTNQKVGDTGYFAISTCVQKIKTLWIGDEDDANVTIEGVSRLSKAIQDLEKPMENLFVVCNKESAEQTKEELKKARSKVEFVLSALTSSYGSFYSNFFLSNLDVQDS